MSATHVAFLRGVNVGGKNLIKMPALTAHFESLGLMNVSTYLQSGNVLFEAPRQLPAEFNLDVPVVVFSRQELASVIANNPYPEAVDQPTRLLVMFLADPPTPAQVASLDPARSHPDRFHVADRHIYLHLARGAADTKLTNAYFDSKLKTVSTGRNWRTITNIFELMH